MFLFLERRWLPEELSTYRADVAPTPRTVGSVLLRGAAAAIEAARRAQRRPVSETDPCVGNNSATIIHTDRDEFTWGQVILIYEV